MKGKTLSEEKARNKVFQLPVWISLPEPWFSKIDSSLSNVNLDLIIFCQARVKHSILRFVIVYLAIQASKGTIQSLTFLRTEFNEVIGHKNGTLVLNEDDQNFLETFSRQLRMCLNVWKNYTLSLPLA